LVSWRTGLAAVSLAALLAWKKGGWLTLRVAVQCVAVGLLIGLHWLLFFLPSQIGTVSAGLVGVSTTSLWCALLEPLFVRGKRLQALEMGLAGIVILGAFLISYYDASSIPALLAGAASALVATVFSFCNGHLVKHHDPYGITFYEMLGASVLMGLVGLFWHGIGAAAIPRDAGQWIALLLLSQLCTVWAFTACVRLQKTLSVYTVGLTANMEPIYGMLLAAAFFAEHQKLHISFWIGSGLILSAVLAYLPLSERRQRAAKAV
jgi:drug/metabolite transporter (DMT)-like permease